MTTATYGGDEVSALVFDIGSSTSKVGYAGEDTPKSVYPSWVGIPEGEGGEPMEVDMPSDSGNGGYIGENGDPESADTNGHATARKSRRSRPVRLVGETRIYPWRENMELKNPMKEGIVDDWDLYETLWNHAFSQLRANPAEHPLLLSEPSWNPRESREKLIELAFEKYDVPCFYLARSAVLSAFAAGRSTALVLDSGGTMTSAVPVVDGYVLKKAIHKQPFAGDFVSNQALLYLREMGITVTPQYLVAKKSAVDAGQPAQFEMRDRPNTTESYHRLAVERAVNEFKETVCHVSEFRFDETALLQRPVKNYEFPDGYNNSFGIERFKITEAMFNPRFMLQDQKRPADMSSPEPISVIQLLQNSINACDPDLRTQLYPNVVLTGANTLLPGFADRVHSELLSAAPGFKTKIQAAGQTTERRFSPWIGGSILASLGTFHQLWISKQEYAESGTNVEKRLH